MDVVVPLLARFYESSDGQVYPYRETVDTEFWERYLKVFDRVIVVARINGLTDRTEHADEPITKDNIEFVSIPDFSGPLSFILQTPRILSILTSLYSGEHAYILRVPDPLAYLTSIILEVHGHPYGVEVCADAENTFSKDAYEDILRPLIQFSMTKFQTRICARAKAVSYVTESSLQKKYPSNPDAFETHYSSIHLTNDFLVDQPNKYVKPLYSPRIISVGGIEKMYKAPDVMLDSIAHLNEMGVTPKLLWLGGGRYRDEMITRSQQLGIEDQVSFPGRVDSEKVKVELSRSDLFVLPSRMEGLPRAMIEAMARGLPCVGTTVDGIPELIDDFCTVPPNKPRNLAEKIAKLVTNPDEMTRQATRNLEKAREYHQSILTERRTNFYQHLRDQTHKFSHN